MAYAGFGSRAFALIIDMLIWVPLSFAYAYVYNQSIPAAKASFVLYGLAGMAYWIVLHAHWGQTVGKMAARIKVTGLDGSKIGYGKASLRSLVDILFATVSIFGFFHALSLWTGPEWSSLGFVEKQSMIHDLHPTADIYRIVGQVWVWSELVVMLTNKKRRALHDFIAGTVVIRLPRSTR